MEHTDDLILISSLYNGLRKWRTGIAQVWIRKYVVVICRDLLLDQRWQQISVAGSRGPWEGSKSRGHGLGASMDSAVSRKPWLVCYQCWQKSKRKREIWEIQMEVCSSNKRQEIKGPEIRFCNESQSACPTQKVRNIDYSWFSNIKSKDPFSNVLFSFTIMYEIIGFLLFFIINKISFY